MSTVIGRAERERDANALKKRVVKNEQSLRQIRRALMTKKTGDYEYDRIVHLEARVAKLDKDTAPNYPPDSGGRKRFRRKTKRTRKTKRKSRRRKSRKTKRRRRRRRKSRR